MKPRANRRSNRRRSRHTQQRRACRLESLETRRVMDVAGLVAISGFQAQDDYAVAEQSGEITIDVVDNDFATRYWYAYDDARISPGPSRAEIIDSLVVEDAENGSVELTEDGNVRYQPNDGFNGVDRFTYTIEYNGKEFSASAFVHVVNPVFALRDWYSVESGSENNLLNVLENDIHSLSGGADTRISSVDSGDLDGTIQISADRNTLIVTPNDSAQGEYFFTYVLEDSAGNQSEATVYVEVNTTGESDTVSVRQTEQTLLESAFDQYRHQFGQRWFQSYGNWGLARPRVFDWGMFVEADVLALSNAALASESADADSDRFSETNNQESTVDEADLVKTDGDYLYTVSNWTTDDGGQQHQLVITDVRDPTQMRVVGRYGLEGPVKSLFLNGDRVVVLSQNEGNVDVTVIDVSDRSAPALDYESEWIGDLTEARMVGDQIYVVAQTYGDQNAPVLEHVCYEENVGCFFETASAFAEQAELMIGDSLNVSITTTTADGEKETVSIDSFSLGAGQALSGQYSSAIVSFDIQSDENGPTDMLTIWHGGRSNVYVSSNSIFLFNTEYSYGSNEPYNDLLAATSDSFAAEHFYQFTRIDQVSFDDNGDLQLVASGAVPGRVLNSFSISEHNGYVRIATETFESSSLYVLQRDGEQMKLVGSVGDIAPNEQIYSVRFDGDRGFMVTFRRVDPLFVFDLSDPAEPTLLGELKVSGYSNYLQVLDEDHVMGIGRDADEFGRFEELQISIFDISDWENPQLKHRYSFEGGRDLWSPLMQDAWNLGSHQSVHYFASHQTLVLPTYSGGSGFWSWNSLGTADDVSMRILDIDLESGISELGQVDFEESVDPDKVRAVRIGENLLSIAPGVIKANVLRTPDQSLGQVLIGAAAVDDVFVVRGTSPTMIDLLANDGVAPESKAIEIDQPSQGGRVEIVETGEVQFTPDPDFIGKSEFSYTVDNVTANVTVEVKPEWHNSANAMDVDGDGGVFARDILRIINLLENHGRGKLEKFDELAANDELKVSGADVNQDGSITAIDVLQVINFMGEKARSLQSDRLEGETTPVITDQYTDVAIGELF